VLIPSNRGRALDRQQARPRGEAREGAGEGRLRDDAVEEGLDAAGKCFPHVLYTVGSEMRVADCGMLLQATSHGNEPSKGAKIDQQLEDEEAEILKKKGAFGPK